LTYAIKPAERIDMIDMIKKISSEVNSVLEKRIKERYFPNIILLYSFIEGMLKWLISVKAGWMKTDRALPPSDELVSGEEFKSIEEISAKLTSYDCLQFAFLIDVVDLKLYRRLLGINTERNKLIHKFWIHSSRDDFRAFRRILEDLANVPNEFSDIISKLSKEMSPDLLRQTSVPFRKK